MYYLFGDDMENSAAVLDALKKLDIPFEHYTHVPVVSAADRYPLGLDYGAVVCKNLLVTTRNESRFLLCMLPCEKEADLKEMRTAFLTSRLCFASEEALKRILDQKPGSVGVLSIINDRSRVCEVVLDSSLKDAPRIAMHPGVNTETVVLSGEDLARFVRASAFKLTYFSF